MKCGLSAQVNLFIKITWCFRCFLENFIKSCNNLVRCGDEVPLNVVLWMIILKIDNSLKLRERMLSVKSVT